MPGFVREHLRPLAGSAGLHLALLAALAGTALNWTSKQPPVQLAIEGVVVDARDLPKSLSGTRPSPKPVVKPQPAPAPVVEPPPPEPAPVPEEDMQAKQKEAEAARSRTETEAKAKAKARAEAEQQQAVEREAREKAQAQQKKQAEADAKRKAAEEAEQKKAAEAEAKRKKEEDARAAHEAKVRSDREADLKRQLAAEEEGAAVARSGVVDEYRSMLAQAIERNWIRPPSARAGLECTLFVTQATGGTVVDVKLGACNGDQAVRESIVNAVYRASPLPAPRDPRAFERKLEIVFKPTE
jgi:colicin import membrane protein